GKGEIGEIRAIRSQARHVASFKSEPSRPAGRIIEISALPRDYAQGIRHIPPWQAGGAVIAAIKIPDHHADVIPATADNDGVSHQSTPLRIAKADLERV